MELDSLNEEGEPEFIDELEEEISGFVEAHPTRNAANKRIDNCFFIMIKPFKTILVI